MRYDDRNERKRRGTMFYKAREVELKNGSTATIRSIFPEEAQKVIEVFSNVSGQTKYLLTTKYDKMPTLDGETAYLSMMQDSKTNVQLGAYVNNELVGLGDIHIMNNNRIRVMHRCGMGISLDQSVWGLGLGSRMMEALIDCAQRVGFEQIELEVLAENEKAVNLYKKYGFEIYGTRPNAMKDPDGTYFDEHLMVKSLTSKFEPEEKATTDLEEWIEEQGIQLRY